MRKREFNKALEELLNKAQPLLVSEEVLSEEATIDGHLYKISLGEKISYFVDGTALHNVPYKAGEKGWQKILGGLTTKIELAQQLNEKLMEAAVQPYMAETVMDRLTDSGNISDNEAILQKAVDRRLKLLIKLFSGLDGMSGTYPLPSPSVYSLELGNTGYSFSIRYGQVSIDTRRSGTTFDLRNGYSFLENFKEIQERCQELEKVLRELHKLLRK